MDKERVIVVSVVYGSRWNLLKQVLDATLQDSHVKQFIIVDNGSHDRDSILAYAKSEDRVVILHQEENIGFSGAITKGIKHALTLEGEYLLILDDDSVPEKNAIGMFLDNLKFFDNKPVVLCGNRVDVPGNKDVFRQRPFRENMPKGTIFEVFSLKKIKNAFNLLLRITPKADATFVPIVPAEAFVTGGTFLPMEIVKNAPLPDEKLFIYGEDLEYAWRIRRMGYPIYVCARPIINDIDMTFPAFGNHIFGLFDDKTPDYKVFFRMRNAVIISKRNTNQSTVVLTINIVFWFFGLIVFGLFKAGLTNTFFSRITLIRKAMWLGFNQDYTIPKSVTLPS